jgi:hypothetical protein
MDIRNKALSNSGPFISKMLPCRFQPMAQIKGQCSQVSERLFDACLPIGVGTLLWVILQVYSIVFFQAK